MKRLIEENYQSIVGRGLITQSTTKTQFINKLNEEVQEFIEAYLNGIGNKNEELADIILVCLNIAKHHDIDIEAELKNKIAINKKRRK